MTAATAIDRRLGSAPVRALATAVSAIAFGLSFPPTSWTALAWVALVPLLAVLPRAGARETFLLLWGWSVLMAYVVGDWMPRSVSVYYLQPAWVGVATFVLVSSSTAAVYYVAFGYAYRALARRWDRALPFLAAAAWVTAELGRGRLFTGSAFFIGNPWALAGYSQPPSLPMLQVASWTGVYGIGFVLVCVSASLARAVERRPPLPGLFAGLAAAGLPGLCVWAWGTAVLGRAPAPGSLERGVAVAVVQGNVDVGSRWQSDLYGRNLEHYLRLTGEAIQAGSPEVVFWPEAAMTFFVEREETFRRAMARVLSPRGVELVAGAPRALGVDPERYTNSVYRIAPGGEIRGRYDKELLVPFAEYFPLAGIDVLRRRFGAIRVFEHGTQVAPLDTRAGRAGVAVCNEAMLPEVVSRRVAAGAEYLLNPSNDTWISDEKFTTQQFHIVTLRAVEQRRWLVRASTSGPSALVDPFGRVTALAPAGEARVLHGEIEARRERTFFSRWGDAFALSCAGATAMGLARRRARPVRARSERPS